MPEEKKKETEKKETKYSLDDVVQAVQILAKQVKTVVDDVGALIVIAVFYSDAIQAVPLAVSILLLIAIALVRFLPAARGPSYAVLGFALWIALYLAGIHPTLAF